MRRALSFGAIATIVLSGASIVLASWLTSSAPASASAARAAALPAGQQPTATLATPASVAVDLSWAASTGGAPVAGYEVHAYATSGGAPRAVGGSCTGLLTGTSCTDTAVPTGAWRYSIVPRQLGWSGIASPLSTSVTVDPGYRSFVVSDTPVAYWRLGESSGTNAADEIGTSHGTYTNGYTLGQTGAVSDPNTAVALNGSNGRVVVPSTAAALNITGNLSVEAWIRPGPTQAVNARVFSRYNGTTVQYLLAYDTARTNMRFVIDVASGRLTATSNAELRDGLWHHIVGTWDGATARLYVDGVVQTATGTGSGAVQVANTTTMIGSDSVPGGYYSGMVDEAAVYASALTPARILTHHQQGVLNRPTAAVTFPVAGARYNTAGWDAGCSSQICGTATDPDGTVASAAVSVRQSSTGLFYNGTSFASASRAILPATGTTSWAAALAGSSFPADGTYILTAAATDNAGFDGGVNVSFTIDRTAPSLGVTFPAASANYNTASWNGGCTSRICGSAADTSGIASTTVSIRQGTGNYWNGTAFASASEVLLAVSGTTNWTRSHPAANFPTDGSYTVRAVATDGAGNTGTTSRTFTIDRAAPTAAVTFPVAAGTYGIGSWNAGCSVQACGTASDATSGVASVTVSIRQGVGNYWNGTGFGSVGEVLLPATGTTAWTRAFAAANFPADGAYTVRAVATDAAGNSGTASATATLDVTAPAPTGLTLGDGDGLITPTTDEVAITFSEPLSVSSVCSTWSGTGDQTLGGSGTVVTVTDNGADDTLTVTASGCTLNVGSLATGGDYVTATSTFSGSTTGTESRVTWTASTRILRVHLGSQASGTLNGTTQSTATVTYTPHASITDVAANPVATTPFAALALRL